MLQIQRKIIDFNKYPNANKVEYIAIHDTGNSKSTADALNHYKYFAGGNRGASAHYFVDTGNIIQIIDDKDGSWAVGDGKNKYGIHNKNSVSVEMCINDMKNINKVIDNSIDLAVHLLKKHNLGIDKLVRHYDASRKLCPNIFASNNWAKWVEFKSLVQAKLKGVESMTEQQVREIVRDELNKSKEGISTWAKESWDKSVQLKVNDGVGAKNYVTEEQLMVFFDRLGLLDEKINN